MAFNRWMVKQNAIDPYYVTQYRNKKDPTIDTCNNLDESKVNLEWRKANLKHYIFYDSISVTFFSWQICAHEEQIWGCQGPGIEDHDVIYYKV